MARATASSDRKAPRGGSSDCVVMNSAFDLEQVPETQSTVQRVIEGGGKLEIKGRDS